MASTAGLSPAETGTLLTASEVYRADVQGLYRSNAARGLAPLQVPRQPPRLPPISDAIKPSVGAQRQIRSAFAPLPALCSAKALAAPTALPLPQQLLPSLLDVDDICNWRTMTVESAAAAAATADPVVAAKAAATADPVVAAKAGATDARECAADESEAIATAMWRTFTLRQDDGQRTSQGDPSSVLERT